MLKSKESTVRRSDDRVYTSYRVFGSENARKKRNDHITAYNVATYKQYNVRFKHGEDDEVIDWCLSQDNLNAYIRDLIIKDMKEHADKEAE